MLLKDQLNERIAEVIQSRVNEARTTSNTTSTEWRTTCEIASAAKLADADRKVFLSHIAERRGNAAASQLAQSANEMRTSAIFFLARKPS